MFFFVLSLQDFSCSIYQSNICPYRFRCLPLVSSFFYLVPKINRAAVKRSHCYENDVPLTLERKTALIHFHLQGWLLNSKQGKLM